MWVVKLGGSLVESEYLREWLGVLAGPSQQPLVVVPGGGPFSRVVRETQRRWDLPEDIAHQMLLLGMESYAWMVAGMNDTLVPAASIASFRGIWRQGKVPVWLPSLMTTGEREWNITGAMTTDSLSAWLTGRLKARHLVLVKALDLPTGSVPVVDLADKGWVDARLPEMLDEDRFHTWCARGDAPGALAAPLAAGEPGQAPGIVRVLPNQAPSFRVLAG
jgi:aspartokinase-like uncharacterized kinase